MSAALQISSLTFYFVIFWYHFMSLFLLQFMSFYNNSCHLALRLELSNLGIDSLRCDGLKSFSKGAFASHIWLKAFDRVLGWLFSEKKTAFLSGISFHFRPFVFRYRFSCIWKKPRKTHKYAIIDFKEFQEMQIFGHSQYYLLKVSKSQKQFFLKLQKTNEMLDKILS